MPESPPSAPGASHYDRTLFMLNGEAVIGGSGLNRNARHMKRTYASTAPCATESAKRCASEMPAEFGQVHEQAVNTYGLTARL